ncbi:MAG: pyruvate dehydrogenase (acetyl-transferring), homodimeric type [Pelagibacteraceae bacterium TMED124]|mgnify:CR=1 FL=1|nr:pyruvate dehydrogenase (acetyl-transferring), homodimeric type [Candidatus Neomarinimicrobiota bacterium]RPG19310.1 MAG: pyruvate dehydrogenase (acetyl-transferring), homodimeric type [Pelagibacteraceae bacterium TMED124]
MKKYNPHKDSDSQATLDWIESLDSVIKFEGIERAHYIIEKLIEYSRRNGVRLPYSPCTPYFNTIPTDQQQPFPGNRSIERRIKSINRWNAMAMVVRANKFNEGIGGHISTFASSATLYEVGFNHFFKGPDYHGGDLVFFQGHVAPGIYARSYMEGRLTEEHLRNFRKEISSKNGLSSYPHPWLMPNYWEFATVSMGLGPIMAIYQARFMKYLQNRNLIQKTDKKVWAFLGDGEMDEPESLGALTLAYREKLDNLIFVVNCNLQRLDGPVRGNGNIIQELEGAFRGSGWNVIKVIWGSNWDSIFEKDTKGLLAKRVKELVDGDLLKYVVEGGAYTRENFWGKYPELKDMVSHLSDEDLENLKLGGHDPAKIYAAYYEAINHKNQPTVILARTIKGYGLGESGEGRNVTHQQKKLNEEELLQFRTKFNIPLSDQDCIKTPFYKPCESSEEVEYIHERRKKLHGYMPNRKDASKNLTIPELTIFKELLEGSDKRKISTTMAFVRLLRLVCKDAEIGEKIVPIIPDEARTFGIDPLFREIGIYSSEGQKYEPVDSEQFLFYKEAQNGQILEEGITEAGSISSFIAAGTSHITNGIKMIPFFIYYSMFGFQRIGDFIWAAADMRTKGFLIGGTAGKTTLSGEGLQHQDGHSHLIAGTIPNLKAYDPAFSYEIAVIIHDGMKKMYQKNQDIFYYITVENENYHHPKMPKNIENGIIKGMYQFKKSENIKLKVQLLASGAILNEAIEASKLLKSDWKINSDVWSVTSYSELYRDAENIERWNILNPEKEQKTTYIETSLNKNYPVIAVSDYIKLVSEQISPYINSYFTSLGTDGFGRSDTRENLRDFFEINRYYIVISAINSLVKTNKIDKKMLQKAIQKYSIDTKKKNPFQI